MKYINGLVVAAALFGGGCRFLIDVDEPMCETHEYCEAQFGEGVACSAAGVCEVLTETESAELKWRARYPCLFEEDERLTVPDTMPGATVNVSVYVINFWTQAEVPEFGTTFKVCGASRECAEPASETFFANNMVSATVPHGYTGTVRFENEAYLTTTMYTNLPYTDDRDLITLALLSGEDLATSITLANEEVVNLTSLIVETKDCSGGYAEGVVIENTDLDGSERYHQPFYIASQQGDRDLAAMTPADTIGLRDDGILRTVGGWTNLASGNAQVIGTLQGTDIEFGRANVQVRVDQMTQVRMYPIVQDAN